MSWRGVKNILWILILAVVINIPQSVYAYPAEITDVSNRDYADAVIKILDNAKESIDMVMYLISYNEKDQESPVYKLMHALGDAHKRGVKVKVILDYRSSGDAKEGAVSYYAYKFLKDAGIKVKFDTPSVYTHNKTIVIDNKIVVAGSANWSQAALEKSNETNLIVESPQLAEDILKRFNKIELIPEKPTLKGCEKPTEEGQYVLFPFALLAKNAVFQDIMRRGHERAFDVYLLLIREFKTGEGGKINISYEEVAGRIGMDREFHRSMINRILRELQNRYGLIKVKMHYGDPVDITLLNPSGSLLDKLNSEECLKIPDEYWRYRWSKRLTLAEKYCLLINLAEVSQQTQWNEWLLTREQIAVKYGIGRSTISKGMMGLRRYGIIDIEYGEIDEGYPKRMPALMRFKGLYDYDAFQKSISELEDKYGKKLIKQARKYADIVFRAYDLESIKDIIRFIDSYGENMVNEAFSIVKVKAIDNPKRTFKYVVGILKKKGACPCD